MLPLCMHCYCYSSLERPQTQYVDTTLYRADIALRATHKGRREVGRSKEQRAERSWAGYIQHTEYSSTTIVWVFSIGCGLVPGPLSPARAPTAL